MKHSHENWNAILDKFNVIFSPFCDISGATYVHLSSQLYHIYGFELYEVDDIDELEDYFNKVVIPHKIEVFKAGLSLIEKKIISEEYIEDFLANLRMHDLSKFSAFEAFGYARYNRKTGENKDGFKRAWHHHKMHNKHHPEHWLNPNKKGEIEPLPMPLIYIYEMVADWIGAGVSYGDSLENWLPNNLQNFLMHEQTRKLLKGILERLGFEIEEKDNYLFAQWNA